MDPKSAAYWLKAREEAEKLVASMTDEQKAMVAQFEAHFPKSRLIEESKKALSGSK
jgi:lipopolysaccharide biosynthesis regulator YciM